MARESSLAKTAFAAGGASSRFHASPYLFVVGCPRSGTTLLQRLLDHHPDLAVANDTHFIPRCLEKSTPEAVPAAIRGEDIPLSPALVDGVREYHRFPRLGLSHEQSAAAAREARAYGEYVSGIYERFAHNRGKTLAGEKTPDYVRRLPLLHGLFPAARFVHIIRDGRDVALSVLDWATESKGPGKLPLWRTQPVATCALWWRWQVQCGRRDGAALSSQRYIEVNYDSLVSDTASEMRRVTEFLGLPYSPQVLGYHEGRTKRDSTLSAKSRWLPPTPGLRDWRSQMKQSDVALFEAIAGDLLQDLGLPRAFPSIPSKASAVAEAALGWWEEFLANRDAKAKRRQNR